MRKLFIFSNLIFFLILISFTTSAFAKTMNILVDPFENTGGKEYSWISAGMTDTVISDLARIKNISVVSNSDRKKILEEMKFIFSGLVEDNKMIKLGKLMGANVIFTGSYLVAGDRIRVHARLVNVETGRVESTTKVDGTLAGIFDLQDQVVFTLLAETQKVQIADITPVKLTLEVKTTIENKPKPKVTAYEWYAKGLELQSTNPQEALANFNKALDIDPLYTKALMAASLTAGYALSLFNQAFEYLERAEKIFKKRNETNTADFANLKSSIGFAYWTKGQFNPALENYTNAQSIYDRLGLQNTDDYALLMKNIGLVYWKKGHFDSAVEYYKKAQSIYDRIGLQNTAKYAMTVMVIGLVYRDKDQLDKALEYYSNARSLYEKLGLQNSVGYALTMMGTGTVYRNKGQQDRALECFTKAQSIWDMLGIQNTDEYATLMMNIASAHLYKSQLDRAMGYYTKAQSIWDKLGLQNTVHYGTLMMGIGHVYWKKGRIDLSGKYNRMAYDTYVKAGHSGPLKDRALKNAESAGY